jgi:hypothetical protein
LRCQATRSRELRLARNVDGVVPDPFNGPGHESDEEDGLANPLLAHLDRERKAAAICLIDAFVMRAQPAHTVDVAFGETVTDSSICSAARRTIAERHSSCRRGGRSPNGISRQSVVMLRH